MVDGSDTSVMFFHCSILALVDRSGEDVNLFYSKLVVVARSDEDDSFSLF